MTGRHICRSCEIAGYLDEEADLRSDKQVAAQLRAKALTWHDRCEGCDCDVLPRDPGGWSRVKAFLRLGGKA